MIKQVLKFQFFLFFYSSNLLSSSSVLNVVENGKKKIPLFFFDMKKGEVKSCIFYKNLCSLIKGKDELLQSNVKNFFQDQQAYARWNVSTSSVPIASINNSRYFFIDTSQKWLEYSLNENEAQSVFEEFKKNNNEYLSCKGIVEKNNFKKEALKTRFVFLYKNFIFVAVQIDQNLNKCDGPPDKIFKDHLFLFNKTEKTVRLLDRNLYPVTSFLVQALKNEYWLYFKSDYNLDGYVLYEQDFNKKHENFKTYH